MYISYKSILFKPKNIQFYQMKALNFKIPTNQEASFHVQEDLMPAFYPKLHQHHELQITYIIKGSGTLLLEDFIGEFHPGNVFVIGPNVSHVFRSNEQLPVDSEVMNAHSLSLYFDPNFLGQRFLDLPEVHQLHHFIKKSYKGLQINHPIAAQIAVMITQLRKKKAFDQLIAMLEILNVLSNTDNYTLLSKTLPKKSLSPNLEKRLNDVFSYTMEHYAKVITLDEIAQLANMTTSAFCKYFKLHTRKTYVQFLNEIRIGNACKLLRENQMTIEQIAYATGFNNMANFNRKFKQINNITPSGFRKQYALNLVSK